jgi:hypothetical protein
VYEKTDQDTEDVMDEARDRYERRNWEDNIKTDIKEIKLRDIDWIHPAQDSSHWQNLENMILKFHVP